jgi:hypothetical protein
MTDEEWESGEESIDEEGRNETQQRIDEEGASDKPGDASWREDEWGETEPTPHQGEEGQQPV